VLSDHAQYRGGGALDRLEAVLHRGELRYRLALLARRQLRQRHEHGVLEGNGAQ
jgi:hypothetical protein